MDNIYHLSLASFLSPIDCEQSGSVHALLHSHGGLKTYIFHLYCDNCCSLDNPFNPNSMLTIMLCPFIELHTLLPITDMAEALLHVRNGAWFLCLLVANVPDSFNEGQLFIPADFNGFDLIMSDHSFLPSSSYRLSYNVLQMFRGLGSIAAY